MTKCAPEVVRKMVRLRKEGVPVHEIAIRCGVSQPVVSYWTNPKYRARQKGKAKKVSAKSRAAGKDWGSLHPELARKYRREYARRRYQNDPEYRKRVLDRAKQWKGKPRVKEGGKPGR